MISLSPRKGTGREHINSIIFGAVYLPFSCFMLALGLSTLFSDQGVPLALGLAFALIPGCLIAFGLVFIVGGIRPWIAALRTTNTDLAVESGTIRAGDAFTLRYSQTFRVRTRVRLVEFRLILRENVQYRRNGINYSDLHEEEMAEFEGPARTCEGGEEFTFPQSLRIPVGGMHTFQSGHNSIVWLLRVKVNLAGWPDFQQDYELPVAPFNAA